MHLLPPRKIFNEHIHSLIHFSFLSRTTFKTAFWSTFHTPFFTTHNSTNTTGTTCYSFILSPSLSPGLSSSIPHYLCPLWSSIIMSMTCTYDCFLCTSHLKHLKKTFDWKRQLILTPSPSFSDDWLAILTLSLHYCYCYSIAYHAAIEATHHISHRSVLLFLLPPYLFLRLLLVLSYMLNPWIPFIAINHHQPSSLLC